MKKKVFVILFILLVFLLMTVHNEKVLVVEDTYSNVRHEFPSFDGTFVLGYIHSVLLTPADEYFEIKDDKTLVLRKTIYESFGVGLPFEQIKDSDFEIVDGKFILYIEREMKEINMIISPIPKHTLTVNGVKHNLIDFANEKTNSIKIYAIESLVFKLGNYYYVF